MIPHPPLGRQRNVELVTFVTKIRVSVSSNEQLSLSFHRSAGSIFSHRNTWKRRTIPCIVGDGIVAVSVMSREPQAGWQGAGDRAGTGSAHDRKWQQETVKGLELRARRDKVLVFEMLTHK